ncbi:hypothetical protein KL86CLO1_12139 [uncultured Eubacteriales bacterium]|uniref:Uncharacterized protein n=1 Tax=uncultured Eubacteriales bacterium TaxID=172733 RepID=A0A212K3G4_9FIRM|nr:hypothetical protein KL86CLO1_12139 [uncultured Eubacteriales bacterium]
MEMIIFAICLRFDKVDVPSSAYINRASGFACEFMKMIFVEIGAESNFMHMVAIP